MIKCKPSDLRKSLVLVKELKDAGIGFIPIPYSSEEEMNMGLSKTPSKYVPFEDIARNEIGCILKCAKGFGRVDFHHIKGRTEKYGRNLPVTGFVSQDIGYYYGFPIEKSMHKLLHKNRTAFAVKYGSEKLLCINFLEKYFETFGKYPCTELELLAIQLYR